MNPLVESAPENLAENSSEAPPAEAIPVVKTLRIVIVATPRTGTTWLRHFLGTVYDLSSFAADTPGDFRWDDLPARCVVSTHWHPEPEFLQQLRAHEFRVLTMSRHPLDVLISILHFASTETNARDHTAHWLCGEGGTEAEIVDANPTSARFLNYVISPRAKALFSVSPEWSPLPGVMTVRYESLLFDPVAEFGRVVAALEPAPASAIAAAIGANTIDKLRVGVQNQHHWQGMFGLWKRLLPAKTAQQMAAFHKAYFDKYNYLCDADPGLDQLQAVCNWLEFEVETLKKELRQSRIDFQKLDASRVELDAARNESLAAHLEAQAQFANLHQQLEEMREQIASMQGVGPQSAALAMRISRLSARFPAVATAAKGCLRIFGLTSAKK